MPRRFARFALASSACVCSLLLAQTAAAQVGAGTGFSSTTGFSATPAFSSGASLGGSGVSGGSASSFRPNNSTFGSSLGLSTPQSGVSANPFEAARVDPREQGSITGTVRDTQAGNAGRRGNTGFGQNQFRRGGNAPGTGSTATRPVVRVAFDVPPVPRPDLVAGAVTRLRKAPFPGAEALRIDVDPAGVAVIRGTVATAREATLAAAMLAMEPGVRTVRNEIVVEPAGP